MYEKLEELETTRTDLIGIRDEISSIASNLSDVISNINKFIDGNYGHYEEANESKQNIQNYIMMIRFYRKS